MRQTQVNIPPLLAQIHRPEHLRQLTSAELVQLAQEIRYYLVQAVSRTGGHLGPNLGVVELTIALHRVFSSPQDTLIWDTGHQAYVHKLLTGRQDLSELRQAGGLSGYPARSESKHDVVENSHASTALSWADGISREKKRTHQPGATVAIVGDGSLTGGMAWEALNNIAEDKERPLVIVINDNGRSYAPTIGGMAHYLDALRTSREYERALKWGKNRLLSGGEPGRAVWGALHGLKTGLKDMLVPGAMFEELGLKYLGPVDGHDEVAVELALNRAKGLGQPVLVHVITQKGRGYTPAEEDIGDRFHAVGKIHPETGLPVVAKRFGWTAVFAEEIVHQARTNPKIVGITAAMMEPVGLKPLNDLHPERVLDVGIAEQHALTAAAGMAYAGAHPFVAIYATFLNRGWDQLLLDVALHRAPVTVVLDRAGITGEDGASHNGMWDLSLAAMVPGLRVNAPRDADTLRQAIQEAAQIEDGPTLVRYPKGEPPESIRPLRQVDGLDILYEAKPTADSGGELGEGSEAKASIASAHEQPAAEGSAELTATAELTSASESKHKPQRVVISVCGALASEAIAAAQTLAETGVGVTVVDPRWVLPIKEELVAFAARADLVVSVEDGLIAGGVGSELSRALTQSDPLGSPRVLTLGVPREFFAHAKRADIMRRIGLDAEGIAASIARALT